MKTQEGIEMSNVASAFNYSINAPAAGASFPLVIGESRLAPDGGSVGNFAIYTDTSANVTLTSTSPRKVFFNSPDGPINVTLPTGDAIKAGYDLRIEVEGATETNRIAIVATTTFETIGGSGFVHLMALQDNPTLAAHWRVVDVFEQDVNITATGVTGANTNNILILLTRRNRLVGVSVSQSGQTPAAGQNKIITPSGTIPARFRTPIATNIRCACMVMEANLSISGIARISAVGELEFIKYDSSNFATTLTTSAGGANRQSFTYYMET
jgi:hypothetical protein